MSSFSYYLGILKKKKDMLKTKSFQKYRDELFGRVNGAPIIDGRWANRGDTVVNEELKEEEQETKDIWKELHDHIGEQSLVDFIFGEYDIPTTPRRLRADIRRKTKKIEDSFGLGDMSDDDIRNIYIDNIMEGLYRWRDGISKFKLLPGINPERVEEQANINAFNLRNALNKLYDGKDTMNEIEYIEIVLDANDAMMSCIWDATVPREIDILDSTMESYINNAEKLGIAKTLEHTNQSIDYARYVYDKGTRTTEKRLEEVREKIKNGGNEEDVLEYRNEEAMLKLELQDYEQRLGNVRTPANLFAESVEEYIREKGEDTVDSDDTDDSEDTESVESPTVEPEDEEPLGPMDEDERARMEQEQQVKNEPAEEGPVGELINPQLHEEQETIR